KTASIVASCIVISSGLSLAGSGYGQRFEILLFSAMFLTLAMPLVIGSRFVPQVIRTLMVYQLRKGERSYARATLDGLPSDVGLVLSRLLHAVDGVLQQQDEVLRIAYNAPHTLHADSE